MRSFNKTKGMSIIGAIIFGFIIVLLLSYFNVSIKSIVESPTGQENINYVREAVNNFWNNYLAQPASYLWNDVWLKLVWHPFISNNAQ